MSHWPGEKLEGWITDWHRAIDADGEDGPVIRRACELSVRLCPSSYRRTESSQ
jgi:hypothetical protein